MEDDNRTVSGLYGDRADHGLVSAGAGISVVCREGPAQAGPAGLCASGSAGSVF